VLLVGASPFVRSFLTLQNKSAGLRRRRHDDPLLPQGTRYDSVALAPGAPRTSCSELRRCRACSRRSRRG
jgi:hypothetical protein